MKFSLAYVRQNPVMFGVIIVVFGLIFWFLMSGRASGGGGDQVVYQQNAPDPALQIASLQAQAQAQQGQLQLAALAQQGQNDLALGTLSANVALAELASRERTDSIGYAASLAALERQLDAQIATTEMNNNFQVSYARLAYDAATDQAAINASLTRDLSAMQAEAYRTGSLLSVIPTLKKRDRDDALAGIGGYTPVRGGAGGGGLLSSIGSAIISPISQVV